MPAIVPTFVCAVAIRTGKLDATFVEGAISKTDALGI